MPWLDTGIESLNSSCRCALDGYRYRVYNQLLTDVPWLDTGIESGIDRSQICPGWIQESNLLTDKPWLDTRIESGITTVDSNYLWIDLFLEKAKCQLYAMS